MAAELHVTQPHISAWEKGSRRPHADHVQKMDDFYGAKSALVRLLTHITNASLPDWFRPWIPIEEAASALLIWEPLIVPGLLQHEGYARTLMSRAPGAALNDLDDRVARRLSRQDILRRKDPPRVLVLLDEGVLYRPVGTPEVLRQQLQHLLDLSEPSHVTLQVVPFEYQSTAGLQGAFHIAEAPGTTPSVYFESAGQAQIVDHKEAVDLAYTRLEAIRADAHPQPLTRKMIMNRIAQTETSET